MTTIQEASSSEVQTQPSASMLKVREEFLKRAKEGADKYLKENPDATEADFKLSTNWWHPVADFQVILKESVPEDTNEKLSAATKKIFDADFTPEARGAFIAESRTLLAGHPEALRMVESIFGGVGTETWERLRDFSVQKKAEGGSLLRTET